MTMSPPRPLVEGPSAWIGRELRVARGRMDLLPLRRRDRRGRERDGVGCASGASTSPRSDAPTSRCRRSAPGSTRCGEEILDGRGFVLIRGLPVEGRPITDSAAAYWGVGTYFGNARSQNAKGHLLGHVRDLGLATSDPNVRTYQTTERQHFHTDSCDIVGLLCLKTAKSGGLSSLTSSMAIYNEMAKRRPDLRRAAVPAVPDRPPRRGAGGQEAVFRDPDLQRPRGLSVGAVFAAVHPFGPALSRGAPPRTPRISRRSTCSTSWPTTPICGSTCSSGPATCSSSTTTRSCTTAPPSRTGPSRRRSAICCGCGSPPPGARPLPPVYAERYGSVTVGDRGGIICPGTRLHAPLEPV